jgi:hypothetical protein
MNIGSLFLNLFLNFGIYVPPYFSCLPTYHRSWDSSVVQRWATDWMIKGFESRHGLGIFLYVSVSRQLLRTTQPPIQWVRGALSLGINRPGCEPEHSPPTSAGVKNA